MLYPFYRSGNRVRGIEKMAERHATVVCHNWVGTQISLIKKSVFFFPYSICTTKNYFIHLGVPVIALMNSNNNSHDENQQLQF